MSTTISQISKTSWVIIIIIKTICTAQDVNAHDNFTNIKDQLGNNNNYYKDDLFTNTKDQLGNNNYKEYLYSASSTMSTMPFTNYM